MKKIFFLTCYFFIGIFVYSHDLAEAVFECDMPTVQKYVEKLNADLNKKTDYYIDNVKNPTYLFISVHNRNQGSEIEKRRMVKYLLEHGALIDDDTFFYVLEFSDYEMLWVLYNYGNFDNYRTISIGDIEASHSPINSVVNLLGSLFGKESEYEELEKKNGLYWIIFYLVIFIDGMRIIIIMYKEIFMMVFMMVVRFGIIKILIIFI